MTTEETKLAFITQYVLNRALSIGPNPIDSEAVAKSAIRAWYIIEKEMKRG